jgi:hypothetical protein
MWLYIPQPSSPSPTGSISSHSAPEPEGSTLLSNSPFHALAPQLWWRGKPSPSPIWSRRWNRVSWLRQLSGRMSDPSTAAHGAASWMASLAASRASLIPSPASASAATIPAISGARQGGSSSSPVPGGASSRMSEACSPRAVRSVSGEIWADLVLRVRSDCSRRRKSARRMSASGSSSSAWLTPDVPNGGRSLAQDISPTGMRPDGSKAQVGLQNQVRLWPTPDAFVSNDGEEPETFLARQERQKAKGINGNGMGLPLAMAAKTWPTPSASETRQGFQPRPEGKASEQNQQSLTTIAMLWPTPIVNDHKGGPTGGEIQRADGSVQSRETGGTLAYAAETQWATPRVTVRGPDSNRQNRPDAGPPTIHDQALAFSLPVPAISPDGETSSPERRSLNPLFVEWLMGWPPGWTASACSATGLCRWKALMRSALSALGLPAEAPPAQLGLFA